MRRWARREGKCDVSSVRSGACRRKLPYRDFDVVVSGSEDTSAPDTLTCIDADTGTFVGTARIADCRDDRPITDEEVARMIGGTYRLASIAVGLEMDLLIRRTRPVSDKLTSPSAMASAVPPERGGIRWRTQGTFARIRLSTVPAPKREVMGPLGQARPRRDRPRPHRRWQGWALRRTVG